MNDCPIPLAEFPARLGWKLEHETIYADPPWLMVRLILWFPQCNPSIDKTGIVFDLLDLLDSARRPGGYFLLNCICGYPPDAGIKEMVLVSHPDANTVIWEMDVRGLGPALAEYWRPENGFLSLAFTAESEFLRLVFKREEYEADIRTMLRDIRRTGNADLPVGEIEPNLKFTYEEAMAFCDVDWPCEPLLRAGTVLEFGLFGPNLLIIDGKPDLGWPVRLFTHWSALAAFKRWIGYVSRGHAIRYALGEDACGMNLPWFTDKERRNDFFLLREHERTACDEAGTALASTLHACFSEGATAPGVEVRYQPCRNPAALSEMERSPPPSPP